MNTKLLESPIIFLSILKWLVLAICIGGIVGVSTASFLNVLDWAIHTTHRFPLYFWFLPLALTLSSALIERYAPEAEGYGTRVIQAIHKYSGRIPFLVPPVKFAATILTIAFGGSAGKTGPSVQIGAGLASLFASLFRLPAEDRKQLVICALSAAFSVVFGTPLTGTIFGIEVLFIGALFYDMLFPAFIAALTAYRTAALFGVSYPRYSLSTFPDLSGIFFGKLVISGMLFGLCALLLIETLRLGRKISRKVPLPNSLKGIVGGLALIGLTYLFSEQYLGLGIDVIEACLQGSRIFPSAFFLKMLFVTITLNFCGSGGIITPILFIGATLGNTLGQLWGENLPFFTAIGMVSLLAGAANTPLTASMMAIELFGDDMTLYAVVTCLTSFLMTGHRTVYPDQVLLLPKSPFLKLETNKEIREIKKMQLSQQFPRIFKTSRAFFQKKRK